MTTKTRLAVNHVNAICNTKPWMVFNDRLDDGRRSLKVIGWTAAQYMRAVDFLLENGCKVWMEKTRSGNMRLHVLES